MYWRDWLLLRKTGDKFGDFRPKAGDFQKNIFGNTAISQQNILQLTNTSDLVSVLEFMKKYLRKCWYQIWEVNYFPNQ